MDIITRINHTKFLGREFLTWLWFRSATNEGIFEVGGEMLELWFDQRLRLEATGGSLGPEANTIQAESPTETSEARASALTGKVVAQARLRVVLGQKQWTFTIKGETLGLSSVKIPGLLSREDDDQLYERIMLIEEIEGIVRSLYNAFIAIRRDENDWGTELRSIRSWVHRTAA